MKKLILIRGLPGSGKSTLAQKYLDYFGQDLACRFEADDYFMVNGEYIFRAEHIRKAHEDCFRKTKDALENNKVVIVSNTFTTIKELKSYFELAKLHNIKPYVITLDNSYGSIHNVPEHTMNKMKLRFQNDISELYETLVRSS
jgi:predicted kinase